MQVLQICHSYYPPFLDCARQYSALFHGTEHQVVTVYLTGDEDPEVARLTASDKVIFLGYKSRQVRGLKLNAILKLRKIIGQHDFAFCIAHRVKPTYVALLASCLPVISVHHNYNDYTRFSRRWFIQLFKRRLLMLGVSDSVRDDLRRDLKGWPAGNIQTLYNRINVAAVQSELLEKNVARQMLGLPQEAWIIGNVGRLHHDKDQATLIRAFHQADHELPQNSLLVIMGKGPLEAELKLLARGLSIEHKVVFTGNVPNARQYFKAFNVFALTSDREPFGMVLLEAMAAVLPIICSDCGGGAEVVREVGQLFPFGDVSALSKLMVIQSKIPTPLLEHQTQRLQGHFSDEAAKHHFWQLVSNGAVNLNRHD
jgi:glycosyltransferase involved in cell wall biosynthesis